MSELKPCPFCGGTPSRYDRGGDFTQANIVYGVNCTRCGLRVEATSREKADIKWNARPVEDADETL